MQFDYAHPIRDNTREEIFAVPISNCLFNLNRAIVKYMRRHPELYSESEYPYLSKIDTESDKGFCEMELYSSWEFMIYLKFGDEYDKYDYTYFMDHLASIYVDIRMNWDPIQDAVKTNFFGAISHLLTIGVIKKLYIYDDICLYDKAIQALIAISFALTEDEHYDVQLLNGTAMDFYESNTFQEITSFVLEDNDDLHKILLDCKEKNPDVLRSKYFILPKFRIRNYTKDSVRLMSPSYWILNHYDDYLSLEKEGFFNVGYYMALPM